MDPLDGLATANTEFERRLRLVGPEDWGRRTPCEDWDVRALVNHVIGGNRRYTMLLDGATAAQVDATRTDDHLGGDPVASFLTTASKLLAAFAEEGAGSRVAHHPIGDRTGSQLLRMRVLDVGVHAWDLAWAIDADEHLDPDLVEFALTCMDSVEAGRQRGSFGAPIAGLAPARSRQDHLLHLLGRHASLTKGDNNMSDLDTFLESVLPMLTTADTALHNGDASQRKAVWSHDESVTVFGAAVSKKGWDEIGPAFDWLEKQFSNCASFEYEVVSAGVGSDLAYIVGVEHTTASVRGEPPSPYSLRVTTILRREDGQWKVVHRHADPYDTSAANIASRLSALA